MTSVCAICCSDDPAQGLGELDGRTYIMCHKCLYEPAREARDHWRGYDTQRDGVMTIAEFKAAVDRFAKNVKMPPPRFDNSPSHFGVQAGEELLRVPMRLDDRPIDAHEAGALIADKDWSQVRYRGTSNGYHVFAIKRAA